MCVIPSIEFCFIFGILGVNTTHNLLLVCKRKLTGMFFFLNVPVSNTQCVISTIVQYVVPPVPGAQWNFSPRVVLLTDSQRYKRKRSNLIHGWS